MSGFIICARCGARIKATRERCLKCGDILRGAPAPLHEVLGLSPDHMPMVGAGVAAVVVALAALLWAYRPVPEQEIVRPAANAAPAQAARPNPLPAATTDEEEAPSPSVEPVTAADATRAAAGAFSSGDLGSARARYQEAVEKQPDDAEALNGLGQVLVRQGQVAESIPYFERAAAAAPDKWAYRFNLAHALGQLAQWERASDEYRAASRLFPTDYATQYNLAVALHKRGDDEAAVAEFRRAIDLAPGEPSFHLSLGISLEKLGKTAEAVREYRTYLEMAPSSPDAEKVKSHADALSAPQPATARTETAPRS